jgi:DNA-binding NarL/FixJ family response regulator
MPSVRILLVDDHHIVRQGIKSLLELDEDFVVVGEAATGARALELIEQIRPDVVLLDVKLPDLDGIEVCRQALARQPDLAIIILTAFSNRESVVRCISEGAIAYVLKDVDVVELARTIRAVHAGQAVLDPKIAGAVMSEIRDKAKGSGYRPGLSERELEIVRLMAHGLSNQEIGWQLFLSTSSVKLYIRKVEEKLGVSGRPAIVYEASKRGLI